MQAEKLRLIEWLANLCDSKTIEELVAIKKSKEADWWQTISSAERAEIAEGIAQADQGKLTAHDEVMAKYDKWL